MAFADEAGQASDVTADRPGAMPTLEERLRRLREAHPPSVMPAPPPGAPAPPRPWSETDDEEEPGEDAP